MKAIIEYSAIKEVEKKKIELQAEKKPSLFAQLALFFVCLIFLFWPNDAAGFGVGFGIFISFTVFLIKYILDKRNKLQFSFLPVSDNNYVDIPYKTKLQAIDSKVTCHPECNPTRIMQNESNRLYVLSNSSGSLFTI